MSVLAPEVVRLVLRLLASYRHWTGTELLESSGSPEQCATQAHAAALCLLAHDGTADPVLTYGNLAAQALFELDWATLVQTPSRFTAEPVARADRARLLEQVSRQGYIADYSGVRISRTGRRFRIEQAVVWNVLDESGQACGQAAAFSHWTPWEP